MSGTLVAIRQYITALASFALVGVVLFMPTLVLAATESLTSFDVTIDLRTDGSFVVKEVIEYDFGNDERHGIYRTIPVAHPQASTHWYTERVINIDDIAVTMDGAAASVQMREAAGSKKIRIGDPNQTVSGTHTYTITYSVAGGLFSYETEPPELYWNVTGNEWEVPIKTVSATIKADARILAEARTCYAGRPGTGAAESDTCEMTTIATGTVQFTAGTLAPGENLTIAQSLDPVAVSANREERLLVLPFVAAALVFFALGWGLWLYRWKTAYQPQNQTIIAQYEPYMDMLPMYTGLVMNGRLDTNDITAGIVYLASEGFLKIRKVDKKVLIFTTDDYEVELTRAKNEAPTNFHKELLELLFFSDEVGEVISMADLKKDTGKQKANYKRLQKLRTALKKDLIERGFFAKNIDIYHHIRMIFLVVAGGSLFFYILHWWGHGFVSDTVGGWVAATVGVLIFSLSITAALAARRRTTKGYAAQVHTLGFKDFLSVTDKQRFDFHNAPEKNPDTFMAYLPYAIALSVEEKWAEVFKDVTISQPEWYEEPGVNAFAAPDLTSHLGAFASALAASATVAQSSSSGAGGSGFSGGGAGGGGGGSW